MAHSPWPGLACTRMWPCLHLQVTRPVSSSWAQADLPLPSSPDSNIVLASTCCQDSSRTSNQVGAACCRRRQPAAELMHHAAPCHALQHLAYMHMCARLHGRCAYTVSYSPLRCVAGAVHVAAACCCLSAAAACAQHQIIIHTSWAAQYIKRDASVYVWLTDSASGEGVEGADAAVYGVVRQAHKHKHKQPPLPLPLLVHMAVCVCVLAKWAWQAVDNRAEERQQPKALQAACGQVTGACCCGAVVLRWCRGMASRRACSPAARPLRMAHAPSTFQPTTRCAPGPGQRQAQLCLGLLAACHAILPPPACRTSCRAEVRLPQAAACTGLHCCGVPPYRSA